MRRMSIALAALWLAGCGGDESSGGSGGSGGSAGSGGDAGIDAETDASVTACPESGISKGPWSLRVDGTSAVVRWEACREGVSGELAADDRKGGAPLSFSSAVTPFEITNTYTAVFNPALPADSAGTYYMHEVKLTGLSPSTCYRYTLAADAAISGQVCTARAPGEPFKFLALADTNPGLGTSTRDMLGLFEPETYEFSIHAGDVQYYDSGLETWSSWFPSMAPLLRHGAFFPSIGNHESEKDDEYEQYYARFFGGAGFDGTDGWYHFQTGGVSFFALDSESGIDPGSAQVAFLENKLAEVSAQPGYRFSVLYFHRPLATCGDKSDDDSTRLLLEPMMEQHRVELVVQGHMHGYERFEIPKTSNPAETITYLTVGGGGGALGDVDENIDRPICAMRVASGKFYHLELLEVGATTLTGKSIDPTGTVKDEFTKPVP